MQSPSRKLLILHQKILFKRAVRTRANRTLIAKSAFIFFGATFPSLTIADSCPSNMNGLFEQARAVLRAKNCQQNLTLKNCQMQMGLGVGFGGSALLAAGLGSKALKKIRDASFGICSISSNRNWLIEAAYAQPTACYDSASEMKRLRMNKVLTGLLKTYDANELNQKAQIKALESALKKGEFDSKELIRLRRAASKDALVSIKTEYGPRTYRPPLAVQADLVAKERVLARELSRLTKSKINENANLAAEVLRAEKSGKLNAEELKKLSELRGETERLRNHLNASKDFSASHSTNQEILRKIDELEKMEADIRSFRALPEKIPASAKPRLTERLGSMRARLREIHESRKIAKTLQAGLSHFSSPSREEINAAELILRGQLPPGHIDQLQVLDPKRASSTQISGPKSSFTEALEKLKLKRLTGPIGGATRVITAGAVSLGVMGVASAQGLEDLADAADPLSAMTHMNDVTCKDELELKGHQYQLFPITKENKCQPDFEMNEIGQKILNMDKNELEALAKKRPEVCEFISWNYKKTYPRGARGSCQGKAAHVSFSDGRRYIFKGNSLKYYERPSKKIPLEIVHSDEGEPLKLISPKRTRAKNKTRTQSFSDFTETRTEKLKKAIYADTLPSLTEAKSCCDPGAGVRPSARDCLRYGIKVDESAFTKGTPNKATR